MNNITLKQLKYFSALRDNGQFGLAADACSISQPAMSTQIKDLEVKIGKILFERFPRWVELTEFGIIFSDQVDKTLTAYNDLIELPRTANDQLFSKLNIGIVGSISPYFLTQTIQAINSSNVDLTLKVFEDSTENLIKDLGERKLDVAIVALPILDSSLEETPLLNEEFVLVSPSKIPEAQDEKLETLPLLKFKGCHFLNNQNHSFWEKMPPRRIKNVDGNSLSTLVQMVSMGLGVTLIPEMAIEVETRIEKVSVSNFTSPKPSRTVGMVWRKSSPMINEFRQIADIIKVYTSGLSGH
ncbi:MAG: LysR family transcriptional regulator [Octadecabacter sp.]|nr:LysR family transcriptional regulator [Octadecabacter sp.]